MYDVFRCLDRLWLYDRSLCSILDLQYARMFFVVKNSKNTTFDYKVKTCVHTVALLDCALSLAF